MLIVATGAGHLGQDTMALGPPAREKAANHDLHGAVERTYPCHPGTAGHPRRPPSKPGARHLQEASFRMSLSFIVLKHS